MRIAHFTSSLLEPLGGAEQYCLALARHQVAAGHNVTVVTGWVSPAIAESLAVDGIDVVVAPTVRPYSPDGHGRSTVQKVNFHLRELADSIRSTPATRALEDQKYEVIHIHRFAGFGTSVFRVRGARIVHTAHDFTLIHSSASLVSGGRLLQRPGALQWLRSRILARALPPETTVIFPSDRTQLLHHTWGLRALAQRSIVVPHGWPAAPADTPQDHTTANGTVRPVSFLFLGKLTDHKGILMLLEAWGDGIAGAELRIGGDGPFASIVRDHPTAELLGWLDESGRAAALARADVLVFPSLWPENFPIVVAESILAGLPVVTTERASPPLIENGVSGLVTETSSASLRDALVRLTEQPRLLARVSAGAREKQGALDMHHHGTTILRAYAEDLQSAHRHLT